MPILDIKYIKLYYNNGKTFYSLNMTTVLRKLMNLGLF